MKMVTTSCRICGGEIHIKKSHFARGWGKFCSLQCRHAGQCKGKKLACARCGKETYRGPRALKRSQSGEFFCSKSCQTLWRNSIYVGEKHANFKNGRTAYRSILARAMPHRRCEVCSTEDARVLQVHHKDRNRENNVPANLAWLCFNCHFLVHHYDVGRDRGLLVERS